MIETNQPKHWQWRQLFPYIILATVFFAVTIVIGTYIPAEISSQIISELKLSLESLLSSGPFVLLVIIFLNNAIKTLLVIISGIALGIPSIIFIAFNGLTIGIIIAALQSPENAGLITAALAPHGIIEIPALILATALGMSIGIEALRFFTRQPSMAKNQLQHSLKIYGQWILPGLLVAALIEVFITPLVITMVSGQSVAIP